MTQPEDRHPARRIIIRRGRAGAGGFTGGGSRASARSGGMGTPRDIGDEVDDAIDPERMNERVGRLPAPAAPNEPDRLGPGQLLNTLETQGGSAAYSREYRLTLVHRMLMRRIPLQDIATAMGVSVSTIEKDRVLLKTRLREIARGLDADELVGEGMEFYDDVTASALRVASRETGDGAVPTPMRLAAMRTALAARGDRSRFLQTAGVFDVVRFRRADDGGGMSDVQAMMQRTGDILEALRGGDEDALQSSANEPSRRPRRPGGFKEFSPDDPADPEVMDI